MNTLKNCHSCLYISETNIEDYTLCICIISFKKGNIMILNVQLQIKKTYLK
jgi:hypothetical protein